MPSLPAPPASIETRQSWIVAITAVTMLAVAQGGPLTVVVGLPRLSEHFGTRGLPSFASSLAFFGTGFGGMLCGWMTQRIGMRLVAMLAGVMLAAGLALASGGAAWQLLAGIGIGVGVFGTGALFPPMVTHVSMWFDRRRGSALALVSSGQFIAGALWPPIFERTIEAFGWQATMLGYAVVAAAVIVPLAALVIRPPPIPSPGTGEAQQPRRGQRVLGMEPNLALALLAIASFMCCVPMAMPAAHLVAFCVDIGIGARAGAAMLSVLLLAAFLSRQFWGALSDRLGGIRTVFIGNVCQTLAMAAFLTTTDEAGLFVIAGLYGLGFGGIVPAYVLAVRDKFPREEAYWRVPALLFLSLSGMAFGAWLAGVIYDRMGNYAAAWAVGIAVNLAQLCLVGFLMWRERTARRAMA
ncbi:MAG: MFS transporter [Acetobacteraceae bacterium]|nr:MFS transporter [Acetobacteraceae bacterium]